MISSAASGTVSLVLSLAALVFFGIVLSLLVNKRLAISKDTKDIRDDIRRNEERLYFLEARMDSLMKGIVRANAKHSGGFKSPTEALDRNQSLTKAIRKLESEKERSKVREAALRKEFSDYILQIRSSAKGERLEYIVLTSGRRLEKVTIMEITKEGLTISHSGGVSRLKSKELSLALRERFQLSSPLLLNTD
ncbi:MAG: hypothetical protein ACSHX7_00555 [Luteolibacter sp.]